MDVLVLGSGGTLGSLVCAQLAARGHNAIAHRRDRAAISDRRGQPFARADVIVHCAGASVAMAPGKGWRGYRAVDVPLGLAVAAHARATNARMIYVAAHHPPALRDCAYVDAHERVAAAMHDLDGAVVRATGFYSAFASLVPMVRAGLPADVGTGRARTNPICERDLAEIVVDIALGGEGPRDVTAGGPEVLTRAEIYDLVAAAAGRRVRRLPLWLGRPGAALLSLVHPRIGQFARFAVGLAQHDAIAPALGTTRLRDYLQNVPPTTRPSPGGPPVDTGAGATTT